MIVPKATNIPATPWHTWIWRQKPGPSDAAHLAHAFLQRVHAGMHEDTPPPLMFSGNHP